MNLNLYKTAGISALLLAVLFPLYWLSAFDLMADDVYKVLEVDMKTLTGFDALFVFIGLLEVGVYLTLRRAFQDQLNGGFPAAMLVVMSILVILFHSTVVIDVLYAVGVIDPSASGPVDWAFGAGVSILFLYGIAALALAIGLLTRFNQLPRVMKVFACGLLVAAVLQITMVFALFNIVLFPILMLIVAVHFFVGEPTVEVV